MLFETHSLFIFQGLERIVTTFYHYIEWNRNAEDMIKSLKKVRAIHQSVNLNATKKHDISITQLDMIVAQVKIKLLRILILKNQENFPAHYS